MFVLREFLVTSSNATSVPSYAWEEQTGLINSLIPQSNQSKNASQPTDATSFNNAQGGLKLGPAPVSEGLRTEAERVLREKITTGEERDILIQDVSMRPAASTEVVAPQVSDLPPYPPLFKTIDIKREVEKFRDARKRIKLDPSALAMERDVSGPQAAAARARALPSICAYTLHDVGDG